MQLVRGEIRVQGAHDRAERDIPRSEGGLQLLGAADRQGGGGPLQAGVVGRLEPAASNPARQDVAPPLEAPFLLFLADSPPGLVAVGPPLALRETDTRTR